MIVIDVSVFIDSLFSSNPERYRKAIGFLKAVDGMPLYAPRIFRVELIAVARRLGFKGKRQELLDIAEKLNLVEERDIISVAEYVADQIHPRAVDAYYIAAAIITSSILVSNDKLMVKNARKTGIEAFYLLEDYEVLLNRVERLKHKN